MRWCALGAWLIGCAPVPPVVDLHADLAHAAYASHARLQDVDGEVTADRLARGNVEWLVLPLFVEAAYEKDPARVRDEYEATWRALSSLDLRTRATLAFEGADGFADDPRTLDPWFSRGACVVGLVHDRNNALAGSSTDPSSEPPGLGLTEAGRALAAHVIELGGILDVAHASDRAARELIALANARGAVVIDSHTGMRSLAESRRNLGDDLARAIAGTDGIVGISMHSGHVGRTPGEPATLDDVAAHVERAIAVAGIDHVALGSDFDGLIVPPVGSDGEATWPALAKLLARRGLDASAVRAVFAGNARRVLSRCPH